MQKLNQKLSRVTRVRAVIKNSGRPRLTIFRSNEHLWAQIIDDSTGKTLVSVSTKTIKGNKGDTKSVRAALVGTEIAKLGLEKKIKQIVFDRGAYKYHGRVKAVADAARVGGLEF